MNAQSYLKQVVKQIHWGDSMIWGWEHGQRMKPNDIVGGFESWNMKIKQNWVDIGYTCIIGQGGCIRRQEREFHEKSGYWPGNLSFCRINHWRPHWGKMTCQYAKVFQSIQIKRDQIQLSFLQILEDVLMPKEIAYMILSYCQMSLLSLC